MPETLPSELEQFVEDQLATKAYSSRGDLLADAVRRLRETKLRLRRIQRNAQTGLDEIDRGDGFEFSDDWQLDHFFDELEAEMDAELAAKKGEA